MMDFTVAFTFIVKYSYENQATWARSCLPGVGDHPDSKAQEGMLLDVLLAPSLEYAFPSASSHPSHPFHFEVLQSRHSLVRSQNDPPQN